MLRTALTAALTLLLTASTAQAAPRVRFRARVKPNGARGRQLHVHGPRKHLRLRQTQSANGTERKGLQLNNANKRLRVGHVEKANGTDKKGLSLTGRNRQLQIGRVERNGHVRVGVRFRKR